MKNFLQRLTTGAIYVTCIVACILINSLSFLCLFAVITWLCLREFYGLINTQKQAHIHKEYHGAGGLLLFVSAYLYNSGINGNVFYFYLLYIAATFIAELYKKQQDPIRHLAYIFFGQVYIALPLALLNKLVFPEYIAEHSYYPIFVLSLFIFIWVNDSFAYLTGILLGKHRLFPRISPKKSWEGFFGGFFFTIASTLVFAHFEPAIAYYHWIGIATVIIVFGTWGDLVESLIKRTLEVKDSGQSLPGHGGFLDRFDSVFLAIYGVLLYVQFFIN